MMPVQPNESGTIEDSMKRRLDSEKGPPPPCLTKALNMNSN
jgi:hypothetical protein